MVIVKNNKKYKVAELQTKWRIAINMDDMPVDYEISKSDCPNFESLKDYVFNNDIF